MRDRRLGVDAGGIDEIKGASLPLRKGVEPVAGDSGGVLDDREPRADESVEERALADVWTTDDGDGRRFDARENRRLRCF